MKKVYLQLTPFFPTPTRFQGPYIYDQVKAIERNSEYTVIVIKVHPFYRKIDLQEYIYQGIKVYNFRVVDLPSSTFPGIFHYLNTMRLERFIRNTIGIDFDNIAFIHAHTLYPGGALAVSLGEKFGIPSLIQHHGLDVFQLLNARMLKGFLKELNADYMKKILLDVANRADLNIGVSQKVLDQLLKEKKFSNPNRYVLYNGVDTQKFYKIPAEENRRFTIGCIGNFFEIKDHMTLMKAIYELKRREIEDITVRLIGSGPTMAPCKKYIAEHGLDKMVLFEKEVDHTQLNDFYNSLDLFVLPSYYEAFGCVYTEAMQTGVPIIAVENQGIEEVMKEEEKSFSLIPKGDHHRLADLIEFRYNNRLKVDYDFNIDNYIQQFLNYIQPLPSKKAKR